MADSTERKRTIVGAPKSSFLALIEDTKNYINAAASFPRGRVMPGPELCRVIVAETVKRIPQPTRDLGLQDPEILLLTVIVLQPRACKDTVRLVAKFLAQDLEGALLLEMQFRRSLLDGALKEFVVFAEGYELRTEMEEKVYIALGSDGEEIA